MHDKFPYSNEQIAEAFNCTQSNIREHKSKHKSELLRNIDYVSLPDSNYKIFWSKSGVIKLADYIGSKEAKSFISQFIDQTLDKPFKEIQPESNHFPAVSNMDNLPDSQIFGLMEMMLSNMKKQAEKQHQLEARIEQVASQKATLNIIQVKTAKEFKTIKKQKLDEIGAEINALIQDKFIQQDLSHRTQEEITEIYKQAHREARTLYYELTGLTYIGAKKASFDSKREFLEWLKKVTV